MPSNRRIFAPHLIRSLESLNISNYPAKDYKKDVMKMKPNKAIKRGDRILTEKPFAYVLKSQFRKERCDNCLSR